MKIKQLVIDTGAFVKNVPIWDYAEEFYTVDDVIKEIRDRQTRRLIDALPIKLQLIEPSPTSLRFITEFTKKTGDYCSLSLPDLKVLALTYELEVKAKGGSEHLRSEPLKVRTEQIVSVRPPPSACPNLELEGFYISSKHAKNKSSQPDTNGQSSLNQAAEFIEIKPELSNESFKLNSDHIAILNLHFSNYPYVKGYFPTQEDFIIMQILPEHFPIIKKFCNVTLLQTKKEESNLFFTHCRNCLREYENLQEIGTSVEKKYTSLLIENECESYVVVRNLMEEFWKVPHFIRWFLHMSTFDEIERMSLPPSQMQGSAENFITNLYQQDKKNEEKNDIIETGLECLSVSENSSDETTDNKNLESESENNESGFDSEEEDSSDYVEEEEEEEDDDDDDEGWITPANIKSFRNKSNIEEFPADVVTACITSDYAVQNTIKHIGLKVMGVDGKLINNLRTFILRCYACFKTTDKMDKLFCAHCGHKTLKKVSVTLNPDGTQKIWISAKKPINTRGTKFSLPKPRGGKHGINPMLVADQREAQQRATRLGRIKNNPLADDYDAGFNPFVVRDIYSRSALLGIKAGDKQHRGTFYWEQRNPNEPMKKGGSRRKKR